MTSKPFASNSAQLVASFSDTADRFQVYKKLQTLGPEALPAIREGLGHSDWHVRHWCAADA